MLIGYFLHLQQTPSLPKCPHPRNSQLGTQLVSEPASQKARLLVQSVLNQACRRFTAAWKESICWSSKLPCWRPVSTAIRVKSGSVPSQPWWRPHKFLVQILHNDLITCIPIEDPITLTIAAVWHHAGEQNSAPSWYRRFLRTEKLPAPNPVPVHQQYQ